MVPSCTRLEGVLLSTSFRRAILPVFVTFPNSPFRLFQPFPPAGDQPTANAQLVEGIEDGLSYQTLLGVTGSGKTFTMANVIARTGRPALIMAPNKTLAAQLYSEMREFFPENAVEYFVSYYDYYQPEAYVPARDLFIEKDSSINEHIEQMRLSATKSLLERRETVIVCTVSAIYGIGDPSDYHSMILLLRENEKMTQRDVITRLTQMQYERNDIEFSRGHFRVRGDVIDIFPAEHAALELDVVAVVLHLRQPRDDLALAHLLVLAQQQDHAVVVGRIADTVDRRHGADDHRVAPFQ